MKIAKESWVILTIGLLDLVTTIVFIQHHHAAEANPIFQKYWDMGIPAFILAKSICLLGPLLILEWARRRSPRFVSFALRGAIVAYLAFYSIGFLRLNAPNANASEAPSSAYEMDAAQYYYMMSQFARTRGLQAFYNSKTHPGLAHKTVRVFDFKNAPSW